MIKRGWVALLAATVLLPMAAPASIAADALASFRVINSPFTSDAVSTRHAAGIKLKLAGAARVTLTIETPTGTAVRHLVNGLSLKRGGHGWTWAGRNDAKSLVPDGDYVARVVVSSASGTTQRSLPVRKGMPPIYPANPGAITVLINPGHGAAKNGAVSQGLVEKELNLDIGLRLRRLLQAAGVNVVMTRTDDTEVNLPPVDVNGDGVIGPTKPGGDDWDGLAARIDIANASRADVHIFNHLNAAGCKCLRGTETFTGLDRSWTPEGLALADSVQTAQIAQLDTFRSATYFPLDLGVRDGARFYTLSPYDPVSLPLLPRPTLMPTLLTESLFLNDPVERELLRQPRVLEAIAIALYLGIAEFLAARDFGIKYELLSGPSVVTVSGTADYQLRVTNTGNLASAGWQLQLHSVPAVAFYDGSEEIGNMMGSVAIPDGLAPGATTTLTVHATAPPAAGAWLVKADVLVGGLERPYLSQRGVVSLQVPLTTQ